MKILYVITGLQSGGAEHALVRLVQNMDQGKYDIEVCSITDSVPTKLASELQDIGVKIHLLGMSSLINALSAVLSLRRIIRNFKPDIIHSYLFHANILSRFAAVGSEAKVISSIREKCPSTFQNKMDSLTQSLVDRYTANAIAVKDHMRYTGIKKTINVIYNGLPDEYLNIEKKEAYSMVRDMELRGNFSRSNTCCLDELLMVANLRRQKDIPTAVRAMGEIKRKHPEIFQKITLLIAGGGTEYEDEKDNIMSIIEEEGVQDATTFLGHVNLRQYYSEDHIWISSTLYEGNSNALLEAMAAGFPIITTDIPENSEIIEHRKTGLLYHPSFYKELANCIVLLLQDPGLAYILGERARSAVKHFTIKNTVRDTERMYDQVLGWG